MNINLTHLNLGNTPHNSSYGAAYNLQRISTNGVG